MHVVHHHWLTWHTLAEDTISLGCKIMSKRDPAVDLGIAQRVDTYYCGAGDIGVVVGWASSSTNLSATSLVKNELRLPEGWETYHSPCYPDYKPWKDVM